jgi:hypothetical protein
MYSVRSFGTMGKPSVLGSGAGHVSLKFWSKGGGPLRAQHAPQAFPVFVNTCRNALSTRWHISILPKVSGAILRRGVPFYGQHLAIQANDSNRLYGFSAGSLPFGSYEIVNARLQNPHDRE